MKANRLNKAQWEQVLKTLLYIGLKKTGIVRTFPRVMVYISEKPTRTGSESSWVQSTTKTFTNFNWVNCKWNTNRTLTSSYSKTINIGIRSTRYFQGCILGQTKNTLTSTFITDLMYCLGENGILRHDPLTQQRQQREEDIFLMKFTC